MVRASLAWAASCVLTAALEIKTAEMVVKEKRLTASTCGAYGDGLPCPSNTPDQYTLAPGMLAPALRIPLIDGSEVVTGYPSPKASEPLVIVAPRRGDPFTEQMLSDDYSIDGFLTLEPIPQSHFVFLAPSRNVSRWVAGLQSRFEDRFKALNLSSEVREHWRSVLHYGAKTVKELAEDQGVNPTVPQGSVVASLLDAPSFQGITKHIGVQRANGKWYKVPRLDGFFQFTKSQDLHNHSPENPLLGTLQLVGADDVCVSLSGKGMYAGKIAVVDMSTSKCESPEAAVMWFQDSGVTSIVLVAAKKSRVPLIGDPKRVPGDVESAWWTTATAIAHNRHFLKLARTGANASLEYVWGRGSYIAFESNSRLAQYGSPINPLLATAGWLAQGLEYNEDLRVNLSGPAMTVPLLQGAVGGKARANVTIPSALEMQRYGAAAVELRFSCIGAGDASCPIWDRIASFNIACPPEAEPLELVRWITPYRRAAGHWLVPVTPLLPILYPATTCEISLGGLPGWLNESWVTDASLRLTEPTNSNDGAKANFPLFSGRNFDTGYNNRTAVAVPVNVSTLRRADIFAVITGHGSDADGCCEFQPTKHIFTVGSQEFSVSFMDALDQWACTKKARQGVEPNGYGAWWFGRDGWCNGAVVEPWIQSVTEAVFAGAEDGQVEVNYRAQRYNTTDGTWIDSTCTSNCGYITMESYLAVY